MRLIDLVCEATMISDSQPTRELRGQDTSAEV